METEIPQLAIMASPAPSLSITDKLPNELILMILPWVVDMSMAEKNAVTPLRLVCKAFDTALQPFLFKTIVLEFRKFLRKGGSEISALNGVGKYCHAVYLDMMVIRDEGEKTLLSFSTSLMVYRGSYTPFRSLPRNYDQTTSNGNHDTSTSK